jgi:transcriptional regulator with XRE-family HTH domain
LLHLRSKISAYKKYNINYMMNLVGKRVQEARLKFNPPLSQEELAARLELNGWKISRGTLAKIESGVRQVTDIELMALSKTLKVSTDWLFDK